MLEIRDHIHNPLFSLELSVIVSNIIMLNSTFLSGIMPCHYAEFQNVIILSVNTLSVVAHGDIIWVFV